MSFEDRIERQRRALEDQRIQEEKNLAAILLQQQIQREIEAELIRAKQNEIESDPRWQEMAEIANSPALREALKIHTLEVNKSFLTEAISPDDIHVTFQSPTENRPVGAFGVESAIRNVGMHILGGSDDEGGYSSGHYYAPEYIKIEITYRENAEARKRYYSSSGNGSSGYEGVDAGPGLGIVVSDIHACRSNFSGNSERSIPVYQNLEPALDAIAQIIVKHRVGKS